MTTFYGVFPGVGKKQFATVSDATVSVTLKLFSLN